MEQVWQWLRQHCLSNRVFNKYEDITEQVSRAWNDFISDVERVKKLCVIPIALINRSGLFAIHPLSARCILSQPIDK